jgi:hypothetical protein
MIKNVLIHINDVSHVTTLSKNYTVLTFLPVMTKCSYEKPKGKPLMFYDAEFTQLAAQLRNTVFNLNDQPALQWGNLT